MQRDYEKEGYPGKYEAGAGGSVLKGESSLEGALRELWEETGIRARKLLPLYKACNQINRFYHGYLCVTDCPKDSVVLQPGETIGYKWLDQKAFLAFMDSPECIGAQRNRLNGYLASLRQA